VRDDASNGSNGMNEAPTEPSIGQAGSPRDGAPLRVLLVHNAYQQRGGEDAVVDAEEKLLRDHGHPVLRYQRHNDEVEGVSKLQLARDTIWSPQTGRDMSSIFANFRPDVVHVHNTFPLISPALYWAAHRASVPVVQTLHNFRLICPQAMLLREGRVCEDCVGRVPWRAAVHRCYRGSLAQSAAVAGMVQMHRALGTWQHKVTRYIALNDFCKSKLIEGGLPADRISVKPNFVDLPTPQARERHGFLFVGRLSIEKGIDVLANAALQLPEGATISIAGTGPEAARLQSINNIEMLGALPPSAVYEQMARAKALLLPSIWYENFPRTLVEAMANGLPTIASNIGAMASIVHDRKTGIHFKAGDAADLALKMQWADANPHDMESMGVAARAEYEKSYSAEKNLLLLHDIYAEAIAA
jgi:glycosyltransferase involved in cell wall biosynthesis